MIEHTCNTGALEAKQGYRVSPSLKKKEEEAWGTAHW